MNAGSGGAVLATDQVGATDHYQLIKLAFGALDTATLVTGSAGLPVDLKASVALTVDLGANNDVTITGDALTALQLIDNLVLAEDAAHVTADPGVQMLAVRKATPA
ncbi:hypothetical protein LCGC14_0979850, partial [marine sediment metagenome]